MTLNDMLDQGIEFQSKVRLCYYDYEEEQRVIVNWRRAPGLYERCCNAEIRYIYTDEGAEEDSELIIYIEVLNPFED